MAGIYRTAYAGLNLMTAHYFKRNNKDSAILTHIILNRLCTKEALNHLTPSTKRARNVPKKNAFSECRPTSMADAIHCVPRRNNLLLLFS